MDRLFHDITAPTIHYYNDERPFDQRPAEKPFPFPRNSLEEASNSAFETVLAKGGYILIRTTDADFDQIRCEIIIPGENPGPPIFDPYITTYAGAGNVLSVAIFAAYREYLMRRYTSPVKEDQNDTSNQ